MTTDVRWPLAEPPWTPLAAEPSLRPTLPKQHSCAVVRVTSDHGGVHLASLRLYMQQQKDASEFSTPPRLVLTCTARSQTPRTTLAALTCARCIGSSERQWDVTEIVMAEACA